MLFENRPEHVELRRSVRQFLGALSTEQDVRRDMESPDGFDPLTWTRATKELGLTALTVPETYDGMGFGLHELAVAFEEAGRALLCAPLLSTAVLATRALLLAKDGEAARTWLPAIASGDVIATLAHQEGPRDWPGSVVGTTATRRGGTWIVTGRKDFVLDGHVAQLLLVTADTPAGPSLFAVPGDAAGLTVTRLPTVDQTRRLASLDLRAVSAVPVGELGNASCVVGHVLDHAAVALAVEGVGAAQALLDLAVAYAKERIQFGRAIGSFQAVKHALVDVHVDLELARSVAWSAVHAADHAPDDLPVQASLAGAFCADAAVRSATACAQVFGGIGFTWEHPAHLYLKRAKGSALLFGRPSDHRERLAQRLALPGAATSARAS